MKREAIVERAAGAIAPRQSKFADISTLAKLRLNSLVVATAAGGYYMAAGLDIDAHALVAACAGTALVAGGAAAINQISERDIDRLMNRTRQRPMADRRMGLVEGWAIALTLAAAGLVWLWVGTNPTAAVIALATLLTYVVVYTPLKRRSSLATVVGAVPGALPPLIGWAAARGSVWGVAPWTLFIIMFFWQLPHFLAISWLCREDYERAGLPMLSVVDRHGGMVGRQAVLWAASLIPFTQLPYLFGIATAAYALGAIGLGVAQLLLAFRFARHRSLANARLLFFGSIIYLPLLWGLMAVGKR